MSDELDPTPSSQDTNSTQPLVQVDPATALFAFMGWLTSREQRSGPFSAHWDAAEAVHLIKLFCDAQGWSVNDETYDEQIKALRAKYPD
jgi:hypothetical protein